MSSLWILALFACEPATAPVSSRPASPSVTSSSCGEERCDGLDNDCDGEIDEGLIHTWYVDEDRDGYGGDTTYAGCHRPWGHVDQDGDCDDGDPLVNPSAVEQCDGRDNNCDGVVDLDAIDQVDFHPDGDGDGFGDPTSLSVGCEAPAGWVSDDQDCDDGRPEVFPGALERCNQRDDDCDGQVPGDEIDDDLDGFEECAGDCDDTDGAVSPSAEELVYDGLDNDCDPLSLDDDLDGDGYVSADDCDDSDPMVNPANASTSRFVDISASAGVQLTQWDPSVHPALCGYEIIAGGVAAADYDQDGFVDFFLPVLYEANRLYRNQGDGTFVDVAASAGLDHDGASTAGVWFDAEGDGDLDLYVVDIGVAPARLYVNDGAGAFAEEGVARGADMGLPPVGCAYNYTVTAADIDMDGDIDLLPNQWQIHPDFLGDRSRLLSNDGAGFFTDVSLTAGLDLTDRAAFSSHVADLSGDGIVDVAVAADWGESGLWLGQGDGTFTEVTATAGVGTDENGMGSDLGDVDLDGDLDWFVTSIFDERMCGPSWGCTGNRLYLNDGMGGFVDGTDDAGVRDGSWGWGAAFLDIDNDGDLDIVHQNGFPTDDHFVDVPMRLFVNDGTGTFVDGACDANLEEGMQGRAVVPADIDNDGDLDLFVTVNGAPPRLLENVGPGGSWLRVTLDDGLTPGNPAGIGAIVEVEAVQGAVVQRRDVHLNGTFSGSRPAEAHFGFGAHTAPLHEVRVTWSDGQQTAYTDLDLDQIITLSR